MITSMMCSTITSVTPVWWILRTSAIACCSSAGVRPGERLVEQHQPRPGREHARDLEPLAPGRAERARARRSCRSFEPDQLEHLQRMRARVAAMRMAQERADHHVVEHGHVLERRRHLEGAPDAEPRVLLGRGARHVGAVERDAAGGRQRVAGEAVEEGRLAGAVRADQADDLALVDRRDRRPRPRAGCRRSSRRFRR